MYVNAVTFYFLAAALLSVSSVCAANHVVLEDNSQKQYVGILGDKDQYHFKVNPNQALSISVEQTNADVKVILEAEVNGKKSEVYELSISADTWLNELLYITADDCIQCILSLVPQEKIDESGQYKLTYDIRRSIAPKEKQIMHWATQAAIAWRQSVEDPGNFYIHLQTALTHFKKAAELAQANNQTELNARYLFLASLAAHYLSDYALQEKYLHDVLKDTSVNESFVTISAKLQLAIIQYDNQDLTAAENTALLLIRETESRGSQPLQALAFQLLGKIAAEQRKLQKALGYFNASIDLFERVGAWRNIINVRGELAWVYRQQGELELALGYFLQALSLANNVSHNRLIAELNVSIAYLYRLQGDINQANIYIDEALNTSYQFPNYLVDGRAKQEKARILMSMGELEYANDVLAEAALAYKHLGAASDITNINYFLSQTNTKLGNYAHALKYAQEVLEHDLNTGVNDDIGNAYNQLALINFGITDYSNAAYLQSLALTYLNETEDTYTLSKTYSQAAEIFHTVGDTEQSEMYFTKARQFFQQNGSLFGSLETEYRFAKVQFSKGNYLLVQQTLSSLIKQIDEFQQSINRDDLRRSYLSLQQDVSSLYIDTLLNLNKKNQEMLVASEVFRSKTLIGKVKTADRQSNELRSKRLSLYQKLHTQISSYDTLNTDAARQKIIKESRDIAAQLQKLDIEKKRHSKEQHSSIEKDLRPTSIDIEALQNNLRHDDLMLYFHAGIQQSHLWIITQTSLQHVLLPPENVITNQVSQILTGITSSQETPRSIQKASLISAIHSLSDSLFAETNIPWTNFKNVSVFPSGSLHFVPFSLLEVGPEKTSILEFANISYYHSLATYQQLNLQRNTIEDNDQLLLVANPLMQAKPIGSAQYTAYKGSFQLNELPFTGVEADAIEQIRFNNIKRLTREQASKQNLLNQPFDQYAILHFATHGISYAYSPSMAGLVLSNNQNSDNLLLAQEISQLYIPAKLVVLSGCQTAKGKLINGEGLMGLSRAFFEAGTQGVIASLWPVQDKATAELMKQFYSYLFQKNLSASEALRRAKLDVKNYRKKNGHMPWREPYYWSGFIYQGAT